VNDWQCYANFNFYIKEEYAAIKSENTHTNTHIHTINYIICYPGGGLWYSGGQKGDEKS